MPSAWCRQQRVRSGPTTRLGIIQDRSRYSGRIPLHEGARCRTRGSQLVRKSTSAGTGCPQQPLYTESSQRSDNRWVRRIAGALCCVGLCVFAIFACGGVQANSGMLASVTGSSLHLKNDIALTSAASGLAAGFLHTLCGPDHLAALTPLTIGRNRFSASLLGSLWGLGHSTGQLVLGLAFVLLKAQFTLFLPFLERWAGTIVGLTLLAIGGLGIYESLYEEDDDSESDDEATLRNITTKSDGEVKVAAATFGTGVLYGLQPDSLFVIIPALALPSSLAAFSYCMMFVIGTVLAMGGYTLFLGTASEELCRDRPWLQQNLSVVASCIAILVGVLVLLSAFGVAVPLFS